MCVLLRVFGRRIDTGSPVHEEQVYFVSQLKKNYWSCFIVIMEIFHDLCLHKLHKMRN